LHKKLKGRSAGRLVLWATEAIPVAVTALAIIILQPVYGVAELNTAFKEFISPVIFFVIATYGISVSIMKTPPGFPYLQMVA
jgi:sodium-dependent dicarboxylate transporter 2/3/5